MKDLIKEVAPFLTMKFWKRDQWNNEYFDGIGYSEALVEELSKRAEAVATIAGNIGDQHIEWTGYGVSIPPEQLHSGTPLFTFPPIHDIEAIENRVAEACAKALSPLKNHYIESPGHSDREKVLLIAAIDDATELLRSGEWGKHK